MEVTTNVPCSMRPWPAKMNLNFKLVVIATLLLVAEVASQNRSPQTNSSPSFVPDTESSRQLCW